MAVLESLPAKLDMVIYQGDDLYINVTVKNQDGTPADLTGAVPSAHIRMTHEDPTILAAFLCTITTNIIHLHLLGADAANLIPGPCVWDLQIATPDIRTLVAGNVTVKPEVTRP